MSTVKMDKTKIEMQFETLNTLCNLYDVVSEQIACYPSEIQFQKDYKAAKSVVDILFISLKKKLITKQNSKKPFKISLEYFQVYFLVNFISANSTLLYGLYERNQLLKLTSILHQEL
ncbi:hypothetical protein [Tenacibaculum maritimum]|uniref:hypothetical protein n=1 Tax=Tenacibaculum maritimum TaxID=107401 RepID=UPI00133037A4|nr:hypothetical protein [Tenacibaculum maritimum]